MISYKVKQKYENDGYAKYILLDKIIGGYSSSKNDYVVINQDGKGIGLRLNKDNEGNQFLYIRIISGVTIEVNYDIL